MGTPDPDELLPAEADALERADQLDSGALSEQLLHIADHVQYDPHATADDLRQLAAIALILARRVDQFDTDND